MGWSWHTFFWQKPWVVTLFLMIFRMKKDILEMEQCPF